MDWWFDFDGIEEIDACEALNSILNKYERLEEIPAGRQILNSEVCPDNGVVLILAALDLKSC